MRYALNHIRKKMKQVNSAYDKIIYPNDLIRYIYQEMSEVEQELLMQALHSDDALMQEYIELLSTVEFLEQVKLQPSEKVVKAIKKMAQSTRLPQVWPKVTPSFGGVFFFLRRNPPLFLELNHSVIQPWSLVASAVNCGPPVERGLSSVIKS